MERNFPKIICMLDTGEEYNNLIEELNSINEKINNVTENKYLIPNLLAQIARVIDQNVQITSISNP